VGEVVAAHAAVLLRERQPEQAHRAHLRDDLVGELVAGVEVADHRCDLVVRERGDGLPKLGEVVAESEVVHAHGSLARG
jgi:hypothetical protein